MNNIKIFFLIIGLLILGVIFTVVSGVGPSSSNQLSSSKYDQFAMCLKESGAIFYGAFWCPHCNSQKKMFGSSQKFLPYVECSTPDGKAQSQICIDKNVTGYPTWEFADGERMSGEISLLKLSQKTNCQLPE